MENSLSELTDIAAIQQQQPPQAFYLSDAIALLRSYLPTSERSFHGSEHRTHYDTSNQTPQLIDTNAQWLHTD